MSYVSPEGDSVTSGTVDQSEKGRESSDQSEKSRESLGDELVTPYNCLNMVDRDNGNVLYDFQDPQRQPVAEWLDQNAPGNVYQ